MGQGEGIGTGPGPVEREAADHVSDFLCGDIYGSIRSMPMPSRE